MTHPDPLLPELLVTALKADPRIAAVWLLGSGAGNRLRDDSDIDLALLPAEGVHLNTSDLLALAAVLSPIAGREVDLGILGSGNLVYARQALLSGIPLFTKDPFSSELRAATLLGLYYEFNEDRREVLNAWQY